MPTLTFQFNDFDSIASDTGETAWANPSNAQSSDDSDASASLGLITTPVSEYLVCTGADLSSLPEEIVLTKIEVKIEASGSNTEITEVYGCEIDGSAG